MDPAVAALIGAGTAAVVAVASQFIGHELSVQRDRRNQKRQRLTDAIVEAANALYGPASDEQMSREEFERDLRPDSVAAQDPDLYRDLRPLQDSICRGIVLLQVHFGHDHPLLDEYVEVAAICSDAEAAKSKHLRSDNEDWRIANIPELADKLRGAQKARDRWMRSARAEVERV